MKRLAILLAVLTLSACSPGGRHTFAGFTFGGGGNTFSAEPAVIRVEQSLSTLEAGTPGGDVYLHLSWNSSAQLKTQLPLTEARVSVREKGAESTLSEGNIVLQARDGEVSNGSFELNTKTADGRAMKVVGSFTASRE